MKIDITKHSCKKKLLQNNDFLFVWNANLIIYKKKLLFCHYFSKKSYIYSSEKFDIKHLFIINLKKKVLKKISSKLRFSLCMGCKFDLKNNLFL